MFEILHSLGLTYVATIDADVERRIDPIGLVFVVVTVLAIVSGIVTGGYGIFLF